MPSSPISNYDNRRLHCTTLRCVDDLTPFFQAQIISSAGCHTVNPHTRYQRAVHSIAYLGVGWRAIATFTRCEAKHDLYTKASPSTRSLRIVYRPRSFNRGTVQSSSLHRTTNSTLPDVSNYQRLGGCVLADGYTERPSFPIWLNFNRFHIRHLPPLVLPLLNLRPTAINHCVAPLPTSTHCPSVTTDESATLRSPQVLLRWTWCPAHPR